MSSELAWGELAISEQRARIGELDGELALLELVMSKLELARGELRVSSRRARGELAYFSSPSLSWLGRTCDVSSPGYSYKMVLVRSSNVSPHVDEETRGVWDLKSDVASELALCQILSRTLAPRSLSWC